MSFASQQNDNFARVLRQYASLGFKAIRQSGLELGEASSADSLFSARRYTTTNSPRWTSSTAFRAPARRRPASMRTHSSNSQSCKWMF